MLIISFRIKNDTNPHGRLSTAEYRSKRRADDLGHGIGQAQSVRQSTNERNLRSKHGDHAHSRSAQHSTHQILVHASLLDTLFLCIRRIRYLAHYQGHHGLLRVPGSELGGRKRGATARLSVSHHLQFGRSGHQLR